MKNIGISATLAISVLLCAMAVAQEQAPAPVYKDGDFWQFRITRQGFQTKDSSRTEGDYEVRFIGGEYKVYEIRGRSEERCVGKECRL